MKKGILQLTTLGLALTLIFTNGASTQAYPGETVEPKSFLVIQSYPGETVEPKGMIMFSYPGETVEPK